MNTFKAILFDLDGTLLDTLEDLGGAMNAVLVSMNFPSHPIDRYRVFVGDGMEELARRVLPQSQCTEENVGRCLEGMRAQYDRHWALKTSPYKGIPETLAALRKKGVPMAVLSNKPDDFTKKIVKHFFDNYFEIIVGAGLFPRKPDPAAARHIAAVMKIDIGDFFYLGDTNTDMKTATLAGMYAAGALWGFRTARELLQNGAKVLIENPLEIVQYFS